MTTPVPCGCTQLLEAEPPTEFTICSNANSPGFVEAGINTIPEGATSLSVAFAIQKASANLAFVELDVENLIDSNPLSIDAQLSSRTRDGFTVILTAKTDSGNYRLRWNVYVTQV